MKGLSFGLRASNSGQEMRLFVDKQEDQTISLTLAGTYNRQPIQVDFDSLDTKEAQELADFIRMRSIATR